MLAWYLPTSQPVHAVAQVPAGGSEYLPATQATQATPEIQVPDGQVGVGSGVGSGEGGLVATVMFAEPTTTLAPRTLPTLLEKVESAMLVDTVDAADVPSRRRSPSRWKEPIS